MSEVLEHLHDDELDALLGEVRSRLAPGGRLLVTVPNGYGWFEMEHFFWWRLGWGNCSSGRASATSWRRPRPAT